MIDLPNLSNDLSAGESRHVRMIPSVYTNVVLELLECAKVNWRAVTTVGANHKVANLPIVLFEEPVESRASVGISNGTIVDVEPKQANGRVPDFAFASAPIGTGAYLWSAGILIAVDWTVIGWGWCGRNDVFGGHQTIAEGMNAKGSDVGHLVVYSVVGEIYQ